MRGFGGDVPAAEAAAFAAVRSVTGVAVVLSAAPDSDTGAAVQMMQAAVQVLIWDRPGYWCQEGVPCQRLTVLPVVLDLPPGLMDVYGYLFRLASVCSLQGRDLRTLMIMYSIHMF